MVQSQYLVGFDFWLFLPDRLGQVWLFHACNLSEGYFALVESSWARYFRRKLAWSWIFIAGLHLFWRLSSTTLSARRYGSVQWLDWGHVLVFCVFYLCSVTDVCALSWFVDLLASVGKCTENRLWWKDDVLACVSSTLWLRRCCSGSCAPGRLSLLWLGNWSRLWERCRTLSCGVWSAAKCTGHV